MAISFGKLRERRGGNFEALQRSLEKSNTGGGFKADPRIWKPTNKDDKSENIIRFLPISAVDMELVEAGTFKDEDLTPMIKVVKHGFQGVAGWYMENCLQTFGEPCPVREYDQPNWVALKKLDEKLPSSIAQKEVLKKRLPKSETYANIEVIKDGSHPENNGKNFLYVIPETIKKMIDSASKPEFATQHAFDPFDPMVGANMYLNIMYTKKKIGDKDVMVPDFKNVGWSSPVPLCGGDESLIEELWRKEYSLLEFHDRKNFKTFEELKTRFCKIMGMDENYNPVAAGSTIGKSAEDHVRTERPSVAAATLPVKDVSAQPMSAATPVAHTLVESQSVGVVASDDLDDFEKMLAENAG